MRSLRESTSQGSLVQSITQFAKIAGTVTRDCTNMIQGEVMEIQEACKKLSEAQSRLGIDKSRSKKTRRAKPTEASP